MTELTEQRLKEKLRYDPETGLFYHLQNYGPAPRGSVAGSKQKHGYIYIRIDGKDYLAHRLAWFYVYGTWPKALIDHVNRDKADNRLCNFREASKSQNGHNSLMPKHNTSGVRGVSLQKRSGKWLASIQVNGRQIYLGLFYSKEKALGAYQMESLKSLGEFSSAA